VAWLLPYEPSRETLSLSRTLCTYLADHRSPGGPGNAEEDRAGDAAVPRSGQSRVRDAGAAVPAHLGEYQRVWLAMRSAGTRDLAWSFTKT